MSTEPEQTGAPGDSGALLVHEGEWAGYLSVDDEIVALCHHAHTRRGKAAKCAEQLAIAAGWSNPEPDPTWEARGG